MPKGAPDYSNVRKEGMESGLFDLGELAVRLGAPVVYDRDGDTLLLQDFSIQSVEQAAQAFETGSYARVSCNFSHYGGYAHELYAGQALGSWAYVNLISPYPYDTIVGGEGYFTTVLATGEIELILDITDFTDTSYYRLRWDIATGNINLYDETGNYPLAATSPTIPADAKFPHFIKLMCKPYTNEYYSLRIDHNVYDLSSFTVRSLPAGTTPRISFSLGVVGDNLAPGHIYLDMMRISLNNP